MKIDSYRFGRIVIDGKVHTSDVIIYPENVNSSWWRREGHRLYIDDIKEILDGDFDVLVVGTGDPGLLTVSDEAKQEIKNKNMELIIEPTEKACRIYNELSEQKKVVAALLLTC